MVIICSLDCYNIIIEGNQVYIVRFWNNASKNMTDSVAEITMFMMKVNVFLFCFGSVGNKE